MDDSRGIVFVATGRAYTAEATETAEQVREVGTELPIALISDTSPDSSVFDHVIPIEDPDHSLADKPYNLHRSPFDETVFLDTDTYVTDPQVFNELFTVLQKAPIAAAFDVSRSEAVDRPEPLSPPPTSFPMFNTGVLVFRQPEVNDLFFEWRQFHDEYRQSAGANVNDQIAFRQALWEVDLDHTVLPSEYNFIAPSPQFAADEVRIVHGDVANPVAIESQVNEHTPFGGRIYHPVYNKVESPEVLPWVAGTNENATGRQVRQAIRDFGVARTGLYYLVGKDPNVGRHRIRCLTELVQKDGFIEALRAINRRVRNT